MSEAVENRGRVPGALLLDGKYRLEAPLASGGMGSVWRARHVTLDRPVAVKFVDIDGATGGVVDRFLREAKVAAAIRHPNVIDILDFGKAASGEPIMVMELLEGESLAGRLASNEPLTTTTAVRIAAQVLAGLDAVHRAGILHRDLKPGNVFLSAEGDEIFARLLDFGVSFSLDPGSEHRRGRFGTDARLVVGTPEYMAPEQAEGRPDVDLRADLYSAAVVFYEMLSGGVLPFTAEHPGQVLAKVMRGGALPLEHLRPDIPEIAAVVMRAMAHDRDERPDTARTFRRLLVSAAGLSGDTTGRIGPSSSPSLGRASSEEGSSQVLVIDRDTPTASFPAATATRRRPTEAARTSRRARVGAALSLVIVAAIIGLVWTVLRPSAPAPRPPVAVEPAAAPPAFVAPPVEAAVSTTAPPAVEPIDVARPESPAPTDPAPGAPLTRPTARVRRPVAGAPASEAPPEAPPPIPEPRRGVVHDLDF